MASLERRTLFDKKSGAFTSRLSREDSMKLPNYREVAVHIPGQEKPLTQRTCEPLEVVPEGKIPEIYRQSRTPINHAENPFDSVGMIEKAAENEAHLEEDIEALFDRLNIPPNIRQLMQEGGLTPLQTRLKAETHAELTKRALPVDIPQGKTGK